MTFTGAFEPPGRGRGSCVGVCARLAAAAFLFAAGVAGDVLGQDPDVDAVVEDDADAGRGEGNGDGFEEGLYLPRDRQRQRQLDRSIRLIEERRWSDAATLLDEILAADNDSFHFDRRGPTAKQAGGNREPMNRELMNREPMKGQAGPAAVAGETATWKSLKSVASGLIESLDKEGREAYELQFRLRAERALEKAIADADPAAVMAVARRWFHTPAGGKAAMLLALSSLEGEQPLAAIAWLDRLHSSFHAASFEPTLSVMRAIAYRRAGDLPRAVTVLDEARKSRRVEVRIAGRDASVSYPTGGAEAWLAKVDGASQHRGVVQAAEWPMPGGNPSRNALFDGSRPLLAPRYRVSLARHPEEARTLERHRATMAEQQVALLPAGQPLAVAGRVFVHSALGLLAVDFETGKRVWMQSGPFNAADDSPLAEESFGGDESQRVDDRVFDDATAGTITSDGRLVFAVENPRQAYAIGELQAAFRNPQNPMQSGASNALSAYEVGSGGRLAWRLSGQGPAESADPASVERAHEGWFVGPPLPVAGQLFVMVEAKGGIRLDVLEAASGKPIWSQPLAELDDGRAIDKPTGRDRRFAGLTPSLSEGVLVCPTGAGAVVGVDLATRTLLWAYRYPSSTMETVAINGVGVFAQAIGPGGMVIRRGPNGAIVMQGPASSLPPRSRWIDGTPVVAGGRVLMTPRESNEIHCLDLRSGRLLWKSPRKNGLYVAGVVDERVVVVGSRGVEAVSLATGEASWKEPLMLKSASPCGRGCVVRGRLLLPTDAPEVIEIDLAGGRVVGRSAGRGGAGSNSAASGSAGGGGVLPGNLIAYRGDVISQTAASLDVYHQAEPLEKSVETALSKDASDPWALYWRGQALIDRGRTREGIASVQAAHASDPRRVPAAVVAETILFSLERDFPSASALWEQAVGLANDGRTKASVLRAAVDGFIKARDPAAAWRAFRWLAEEPAPATDERLVDSAEPAVAPTADRWLRGRLQEILSATGAATSPVAAPPYELARDIEATTRRLLDRAASATDPVGAVARFLERFDVVFPAGFEGGGGDAEQPGVAARRILCERLAAAGGSAESDAARSLAVKRDLLLLSMLRSDDAPTRDLAARFAPPPGGSAPGEGAAADADEPWPVGRVVVKREDRHGRSANGQPHRLARIVPVPCEEDVGPTAAGLSLPDLRLSYDVQNVSAVIASDGLGRRLGEPLAFDAAMAMFGGMQSQQIDATAVGRVVILRHGGAVSAFEMVPAPESAGPAKAANAAGKPAAGRNRRLWSTTGPHGFAVGNVGLGNVGIGNARVIVGNGPRRAGAIPRNGGMPLGMRVVEPAIESTGPVGVQIGRATTAGVPVLVNQSLELRDVLTGAVLWTRHRIPAACDLLGDDRFLTVLPRDGRNAVVLSMADGREVRRCDLPAREQRLSTSGRRVVAIDNEAGASPSPARVSSVRLAVFDAATGRRDPLGEFPADARATMVGGEELAVLDGRGRLTLLRIADAETVFSRTLEQMPSGLEGLYVLPWNDRLIVVAARQETLEERQEIDQLGTIAGMPHAWGMEDATPVVTASIWSIDRETGESLWPMPASVLRHGLLLGQPFGLPVLVFARQVHSRRGDDRPKLGLLCLDKRTGHEIHADDRLPLEANMLFTCEVGGEPSERRIMLEIGSERISLTFDGSSISPRPPYQATGRSAAGGDVWRAIEQFMQQIIPFPAQGQP